MSCFLFENQLLRDLTTLLKTLVGVLILVWLSCIQAKGQEKANDFRVYWDNGLEMATKNDEVTLSMGGRIQQDWAYINRNRELANSFGEDDRYATGFRRLRLFQEGSVGKNFNYKLQLDFAGGSAAVKDVFIHLSEIPVVGNVRVGHQKEFFSMEQIASSNDVVFMERSLGDLFIPTRNPGLTIFDHYHGGRLTWGAGIHREADGFGIPKQTEQGNFLLTGRIAGIPWQQDDTHLLAIGSAISRRDPDNNLVNFQTKPESSLAEPYVNSGTIRNVSKNLVSNHSLTTVYGPLSIQGEYMAARPFSSISNTNMLFRGYYGQVSFFLTGDSRNYNPQDGSFDGTIPDNDFNLSKEQGTGAIEIALRYSTLDLDDQFNNGEEITDITAGMNWYLNPNSRIMLNYVLADPKGPRKSDIFQTRFQVTF